MHLQSGDVTNLAVLLAPLFLIIDDNLRHGKGGKKAAKDIFLKVLRLSSTSPCQTLGPCVVTIGNFDGCHRGHQELIRRTDEQARQRQCLSAVLTFDPNPKQFFQPHRPLGKLFRETQKIRALRELGVDVVIIQSFDANFSQLTPQAFYKHLLVQTLDARAIVVGHDFRFGANRQGGIVELRELASRYQAEVCLVSEQRDRDIIISSSAIRQLLQERRVDRVTELLNRPYLMEGRVVAGKKLGRTLGFPTANLACDEQLLPGTGVYAGFALLNQEAPIFQIAPAAVPCVLNVGLRPTVDLQNFKLHVEVHLLDGQYASDGLYDQPLSVWLTHFIRDEQKFASLDALRAQIALDCQSAKERLAHFPKTDFAGRCGAKET